MRYFVRHPTTQAMPRKVKTAFDATPRTTRSPGSTTWPSSPRERDGARGVEIRVGGGTSIMPRVAPTLYEFVELDNGDYLKVTEACMRIFDRQEWLRVNRARARIKVLVDKIGIDEFRELVEEELPGRLGRRARLRLEGLLLDVDEARPRARGAAAPTRSPNGDGREFERFRASNVSAQRQEGFSTVEVKVPRGDLTPEQLRGSRQIMRAVHRRLRAHDRPPEPRAALGPRRGRLRGVASALRELGLGDAGADEITDVVSLPRHRLLQARDHELDGPQPGRPASAWIAMAITDPLTRKIHIKMSGCPNGCGQHHIANIGFYGASIKVGEHTIPAYIAAHRRQLRGRRGRLRPALKVRLPAKRVPEAVERWIRFYESDRADGEEFNAFVEPRRAPAVRGRGAGTSRCRSSSAWTPWTTSSTGTANVPFEVHPRRRRVRGLEPT